MRWKGRQRSQNVEDRRGSRPVKMAGGGGVVILILAVAAIFMGADPRTFLAAIEEEPPGRAAPRVNRQGLPEDDSAREFIEVVLRDTETVWSKLFQQNVQGVRYVPPRLIIYSDTDRSGCGIANAQMGPFYCPTDQQVYIDPAFFDEMHRRLNAPGDFAQAYVIAHEVAHHVQKLTGFLDDVARVRAQGDKLDSNRASVRLELQADYLAGVWAHHADRNFKILEAGDVGEAINAANQIGDDTLQKMSQGFVVPERFTHGTSAQRVRWFKEGFATGEFSGCKQLFSLEYSQL